MLDSLNSLLGDQSGWMNCDPAATVSSFCLIQDFRVGYQSKSCQEPESTQASNLSNHTDTNKVWVRRPTTEYGSDDWVHCRLPDWTFLFSGPSRSEHRTLETRITTTTRARRAARRLRTRMMSTMKSMSPSGTRTTTRTTSTRTTSSLMTTSPRTWRGISAPSTEPRETTKTSQSPRKRTSWAPPRPRPLPDNIRKDGRRLEGRPSPEPRPPTQLHLLLHFLYFTFCFHNVRKKARVKFHERKKVLTLIFQFWEKKMRL